MQPAYNRLENNAIFIEAQRNGLISPPSLAEALLPTDKVGILFLKKSSDDKEIHINVSIGEINRCEKKLSYLSATLKAYPDLQDNTALNCRFDKWDLFKVTSLKSLLLDIRYYLTTLSLRQGLVEWKILNFNPNGEFDHLEAIQNYIDEY